MALKVVKNIWRKLFYFFHRELPYIYKLCFSSNTYKFYINSSVEMFRIKNWGGEKEYTADLISELSEDSIFYDVGSSIGLDTILAAGILKQGKVIAFEPDSDIFVRLKKNILLNNFKNVIALKYAIGNKDGNIFIHSKGADNFSPRMVSNKQQLDYSCKVPVYKIDTLLAKKEIPYPDIIKIDVEGFEKEVLEGMKGLLKSDKKPRSIFIEIHPNMVEKFGSSVQDILNFILVNNYKIVYIKKAHDQLMCKFNF